MKFCKFCGKEIGDANFCPHCGKPQHTAQENRTGRRRLHCPQCRSAQLTAVTEATQTGGVATSSRLTRNITVTGYSAETVNRHYWMCQECGHKFRNLEDLNNEIVKDTQTVGNFKKLTIFMGITCLFVIIMMAIGLGILLLIPAFFVVLLAGFSFTIWFTTKKKVERLTVEKAYLEKNCFD